MNRYLTSLFAAALVAGALLAAGLLGGPAAASPPRRVLVYGDSNSWGWEPTAKGTPTRRLPVERTWPALLAAALGRGAVVEVNALSGRTTDADYPAPLSGVPGEQFNGLRTLPAAVAQCAPLDLVVVLLGTNDLRSDLHRTPEEIAAGVRRLALVARSATGVLTDYSPPKVLVVIPPAVEDIARTPLRDFLAGAPDKSRRLARAYRQALGGLRGVTVVDGAALVTVHGVDGVHLTAEDHAALARALLPSVRAALSAPSGP